MHSTIVITETWPALAKNYEKTVGVQGCKGGALQNLRRSQMNTRLQHVLKKTTLDVHTPSDRKMHALHHAFACVAPPQLSTWTKGGLRFP